MKLRYTPIDEVKELLIERKNNEELQQRLQALTSGIEPGGAYQLNSEPALVFAEYIARPTMRDIAFGSAAIKNALDPAWATYRADLFTTTNKKKVSMLRPPLALPKGQNTRQWIVDSSERQQPRIEIGNTQTKYSGSQTVAEYWQSLRSVVMPAYNLNEAVDSVVDLSTVYRFWAERAGTTGSSIAGGYYPVVMGMYAARVALYADFDSYPQFTQAVASPAYEQVCSLLGVEPIIVLPEVLEDRVGLGSESLMVSPDQTDLTFLTPQQVTALNETGSIGGENE